ncbi:arylsulfatase G-like isoform X2 [Ptychodera flava]|uniref:arylsulfatase G-like isoform X2 n=1 Tax=Ptychodera flava TaxID=63121 RepID=UPI003969E034
MALPLGFVNVMFISTSTVTLLVSLLALINYSQTSQHSQGTGAGRPNFIVLFADDIGWGDLGANWNPNKSSNTPNLDQLAAGGIRFTDFHAGASVCTPSRAALLTARLGLRTGVVHNFEVRSIGGLPLNETTFAETFKAAGYKTGMIGKWHLGVHGHYHPHYRGFDYYFGLPYSNDMGCLDHTGFDIPSCGPCKRDNKTLSYAKHSSNDLTCEEKNALPLYENSKIIEQPTDIYSLSERYAGKIHEFIVNSSNSEQPFLLYVAFAHMHTPLAHAKTFTNTSHGVYGDTLRELDDVIGKIVTTVRDVGKENDTLIWFTGDNGPWAKKCQYGGSRGPFLGSWQHDHGGGGSSGKLTLWEAGHREPSLAYWPGHIPAGHVTNSLLSSMDIYPTMAAIAGVTMPKYRKYDGIDVSNVLFNKEEIKERALFHPNSRTAGSYGQLDGIRLGKYKAVYETGGTPECGGKRGPPTRHDPPLIFNLDKDPAEKHALDNTSEEYNTVHTAMKNALDFVMEDIHKDNTTTVDYRQDPSGAPCCNPKHVVCRCKD